MKPKKILGKDVVGTYRNKPVIKLLGGWFYFDEKGRGHKIKREYIKNIKPLESDDN